MLGTIAKILKALNSDTSPWSLAWGVALGMVLGFTPLFSVHNIAVIFLVLVFRVNLSFFLVTFALCSATAYLIDPLFDWVGEYLLLQESMQGTWQAWYDNPLARLANYNHTITLGSLAVSAVLILPVLFLTYYVVSNYRTHIQARIGKLPLVTALKGTKFWGLYQKASRVKGGLSS